MTETSIPPTDTPAIGRITPEQAWLVVAGAAGMHMMKCSSHGYNACPLLKGAVEAYARVEQDALVRELAGALKGTQDLFSAIADWQEATAPIGRKGVRAVALALRLKGKVDAVLARVEAGGAQ